MNRQSSQPPVAEGRLSQPPSFAESYHGARRMLVFFSALLLAWEYARIRPNPDPETGFAKPNLPVLGDSFVVEAPEVIPNILLLVVAYFVYRYLVEWFQSDASRRTGRASRADLWVTLAIAFSGIGVFVLQRRVRDLAMLSEWLTAVVLSRVVVATSLAAAVYIGFFLTPRVYAMVRVRRLVNDPPTAPPPELPDALAKARFWATTAPCFGVGLGVFGLVLWGVGVAPAPALEFSAGAVMGSLLAYYVGASERRTVEGYVRDAWPGAET